MSSNTAAEQIRFTCIRDVTPTMKQINLAFIVLEIGAPIKTKDTGDVVRSVKIADKSGSINMSVWNELGELLQSGDICHLINGYSQVRPRQLSMIVCCGKYSELKKVGEFCMTFSEVPDMSANNPELASFVNSDPPVGGGPGGHKRGSPLAGGGGGQTGPGGTGFNWSNPVSQNLGGNNGGGLPPGQQGQQRTFSSGISVGEAYNTNKSTPTTSNAFSLVNVFGQGSSLHDATITANESSIQYNTYPSAAAPPSNVVFPAVKKLSKRSEKTSPKRKRPCLLADPFTNPIVSGTAELTGPMPISNEVLSVNYSAQNYPNSNTNNNYYSSPAHPESMKYAQEQQEYPPMAQMAMDYENKLNNWPNAKERESNNNTSYKARGNMRKAIGRNQANPYARNNTHQERVMIPQGGGWSKLQHRN